MNNLETRATLDKQKKKKTKLWYRLHVSEININIYDININTSQSIKSRMLYNVEKIIFLEMHDYYARVNIITLSYYLFT